MSSNRYIEEKIKEKQKAPSGQADFFHALFLYHANKDLFDNDDWSPELEAVVSEIHELMHSAHAKDYAPAANFIAFIPFSNSALSSTLNPEFARRCAAYSRSVESALKAANKIYSDLCKCATNKEVSLSKAYNAVLKWRLLLLPDQLIEKYMADIVRLQEAASDSSSKKEDSDYALSLRLSGGPLTKPRVIESSPVEEVALPPPTLRASR
jgi:hypothetical protein